MTAPRIQRWLKRLTNSSQTSRAPVEGIEQISAEDRRLIDRVRPYTMTSALRIEALLKSVRYVVARDLPGAFVECGVWRGGSVMAMLLQLQALGVNDRDIYLYDTFEGMTEPTTMDTSAYEAPALETWERLTKQGERAWDELFKTEVFNEELVRDTLASTGYPAQHLHFVRGPVEETIPTITPDQIAILRLDTDWYASTVHELEHLYPRLQTGGVLIIDDYGHWEGARAAVDEYLARPDVPPLLLHRIDYTGRSAIKV